MATSKRAQKSEVHETTDDAASSPASKVRTSKRRSSEGAGSSRSKSPSKLKSKPTRPARSTSRGTTRGRVPSKSFERDATDRDLDLTPGARAAPDQEIEGEIGGGPGASDASSGGGAGAGIPGGGTDLRMGEKIPEGDVEQDRARILPESQQNPDESERNRDESDQGGPVRIRIDEHGRMK